MVLLQAHLILTRLTLALLILPFASLALLILSLILLSIIFLSPRSARPFFYIQKLPINRRAADVMVVEYPARSGDSGCLDTSRPVCG